MHNKLIYIAIAGLLLAGCRKDEPIMPPEQEQKGAPEHNEIVGFYLLNEGNMGSNKATLDYYDYVTATYSRNIYANANPDVPKELGDVGNDLQIYGNRLYAVINCSNKIEVLDAATCKRIGQVDIPNCRYITFSGQYAYVSSYAGQVTQDASHAQIGYVARFDTATLTIDATCLVGYQPDELTVANGKLYVANSGGYMKPDYDSTLSVIDLTSMQELRRITVDKNIWRVRADRYGKLWVTSRGDYYGYPARLFCVDTQTDKVTDTIQLAVSDMDILGDTLYTCASAWDYIAMDYKVSYAMMDIRTHQIISANFITDGTDRQIEMPYGLKVNPLTRDILITDAKDYVSPGELYCFAPDGTQRWSVRTGDIPAHVAFVRK